MGKAPRTSEGAKIKGKRVELMLPCGSQVVCKRERVEKEVRKEVVAQGQA